MKKITILGIILLFGLTGCKTEKTNKSESLLHNFKDEISISIIETSGCSECFVYDENTVDNLEKLLADEQSSYFNKLDSYEFSTTPYSKDSLWRDSNVGDKFFSVRGYIGDIAQSFEWISTYFECEPENIIDGICKYDDTMSVQVLGTNDLFTIKVYLSHITGTVLEHSTYKIDLRDGFHYQKVSKLSTGSIVTSYDGEIYQQMRTSEDFLSYHVGNVHTNEYLHLSYWNDDKYRVSYYDSESNFEYNFINYDNEDWHDIISVSISNELDFEHMIKHEGTYSYQGNLSYYDGWTEAITDRVYNIENQWDVSVSKSGLTFGFEVLYFQLDLTEDDIDSHNVETPSWLTSTKSSNGLFEEFIKFYNSEDRLIVNGIDLRTIRDDVQAVIDLFAVLNE